MDTMVAFGLARRNADKELKVFDWIKAAKLIKERNAQNASAGLSHDWEYTGGCILKVGKPIPKGKTYTYLASNWATPELEIDGEMVDCYVMQSKTPGWDAKTYWPDEALAIINGKANDNEVKNG